MYGEFKTNEIPPAREPYGAELVVDCPTCERRKGEACVIFKWRDDPYAGNTGHPHNQRYVAAKMEWAPPA